MEQNPNLLIDDGVLEDEVLIIDDSVREVPPPKESRKARRKRFRAIARYRARMRVWELAHPIRAAWKNILIWAVEIALVLGLSYVLSWFFCRTIQVQENSMQPGIVAGDTFLVNTAAYALGAPDRGDIIVFRNSRETGANMHVKRVIGLPGEIVQIQDGHVYIDGEPLEGDDRFTEIVDAGLAAEQIEMDYNEYFVLGDNRNGSEDSRYSTIGNIRDEDIIGRVWMRIRPFTRIRLIF